MSHIERKIQTRQSPTGFCIVKFDECDLELFESNKWYITKNSKTLFYVRHKGKSGLNSYFHREIMKPPNDLCVDHINGDCLDNRRCNLRLATHSENLKNTTPRPGITGYRGVSIASESKWRNKKYYAYIKHNGKPLSIGYFYTPEEASAAYENKAKELRGEFMRPL